jgi:SAM-dependent methyltransferase
MTSSQVEYVGKDLEAMDFAVKYHRWILDLMKPFLGKHVVEVGAGTGSFSELILSTRPSSLTMVEPSDMFHALAANQRLRRSGADLGQYHDVFSNAARDIAARINPDSIIYVNVLEHIENDSEELRTVWETLRPGGHVFIFVPALPILFSKFDQHIGHFRRYRKSELRSKLEHAGFHVRDLRWFDLPGILPWLLKYRLSGSLTMESSAVQLYDRIAVPIIRPFETLIRPPVGKNLFAVAQRI